MEEIFGLLGWIGAGAASASLRSPLPRLRRRSRSNGSGVLAGAIVSLLIAAAMAGAARQENEGSPSSEPTGTGTPSPSNSAPVTASPDGSQPAPSSGSSAAGSDEPLPPGVPAGVQIGYVAKHVDGDTIWVEVRDPGRLPPAAVHKIRILEIDTPESTNRKDCFGREASEFARRELPLGSKVYLLGDREDKDRYGRFLRYIWAENGEFYNEKVIREGLAKAVLYPPNDLYIDRLRAAEAQAKQRSLGLWKACTVHP